VRISCIIPVFNGAAHIAEALDSVALQTLVPDEIIVIDDGSSDGSGGIAAEHAVRPRILVTDRRGPGHARNAGVAASRGALIAFLDADDLWLADKTAKQSALFDAADAPDLAACAFDNFADPATPIEGPGDWRNPLIGYAAGSLQLSGAMITRAMFDRIGGFDETIRPYGEDNDLLIRIIAAAGRIVRMEEALVRRRLHTTNLTRHFDNRSRLDTGFMLLAKHLARTRSP
jgi:glycosyltransferase involved in cell wall biosynthesis